MATTTRSRAHARAARQRRTAPKPKPEAPMGVFQAIATIGADQAAAAIGTDTPFHTACRERIDTTLGPERTAWRALHHHGPGPVRDALAAQHIVVFIDRRDDDQP
jgi:hypothetical protein